MKRVAKEETILASKFYNYKICDILNNFKYSVIRLNCYRIIFFIFILIIHDYILLSFLKKIPQFFINEKQKTHNNNINKTSLDFKDEFFRIKTVKEQINKKNLTFIQTLSGGYGHCGNALIMLNNLINICENIKCQNIITPGGLERIIKNPIFYKEYNITIFPSENKEKIPVDIILNKHDAFWFHYRKKPHFNRLKIIREEVLNNIPKYIAKPNDLYINIRSGDIFKKKINHMYSQPPLCFYQKIINCLMDMKIQQLINY